jgi:hypothetical protein
MVPEEALNLAQLSMRTLDAALPISRIRREDWPVAQQLMAWLNERRCYTITNPSPAWTDFSRLGDGSLRDFDGWEDGHLEYKVREEISRHLQLLHPAAGWAFHNGTGARAMEFVAVYLEGWRQSRTLAWQTEVGDLMLASLDELCRLRAMTPEEEQAAASAIRGQRGDQAKNLARWARLGCRRFITFMTDCILTGMYGGPREVDCLYWQALECEATRKGGVTQYYLNSAFGFNYTGQDWGICNAADGSRLGEFLLYYHQRRGLLLYWQGYIDELICAELEEGMRRGTVPLSINPLIEDFVQHSYTDGFVVDYFARRRNAGGARIREIVEQSKGTNWTPPAVQ